MQDCVKIETVEELERCVAGVKELYVYGAKEIATVTCSLLIRLGKQIKNILVTGSAYDGYTLFGIPIINYQTLGELEGYVIVAAGEQWLTEILKTLSQFTKVKVFAISMELFEKERSHCTVWKEKSLKQYQIADTAYVADNSHMFVDVKGKLIIKAGSKFRGHIYIAEGGEVVLEENVEMLEETELYVGAGGKIHIGKGSTFGKQLEIRCHAGCSVIIGEDNMFSLFDKIVAGNGHAIFDLETNCRILEPISVVTGNHVWIGMDVTLLSGAYIKEGSIIGANALVNKEIDANVIASGVPAKVRRKNIRWER